MAGTRMRWDTSFQMIYSIGLVVGLNWQRGALQRAGEVEELFPTRFSDTPPAGNISRKGERKAGAIPHDTPL